VAYSLKTAAARPLFFCLSRASNGRSHGLRPVRAGRIVAVGDSDEVMKLKGPNTRVIDLVDKTMIPGLIKVHAHAD
jgi:cytosine/adenosine deaminase-related metal-dependent hydrolase